MRLSVRRFHAMWANSSAACAASGEGGVSGRRRTVNAISLMIADNGPFMLNSTLSVWLTVRLTRAGKRHASDAAASGAAGCWAARWLSFHVTAAEMPERPSL